MRGGGSGIAEREYGGDRTQGLGASGELTDGREGRGPLHHSWCSQKREVVQNVFNRENLIQRIYYLGRAEKTQGVVRQIRDEYSKKPAVASGILT